MSTSPADASSTSPTGAAVTAPEGCPCLALWTLAVAAFSIGVGEFVILGLLPEVAADFAVSLPVAGWLISGYALSVAVGGPVLAAATLGAGRRKLLLGFVAVFTAGTAACALASGYWVLIPVRQRVTPSRSIPNAKAARAKAEIRTSK